MQGVGVHDDRGAGVEQDQIGGRALGAAFTLLLGRLIVGVALHRLGAFAAVLLFLAILVVGFVYEWKKGALDWE